MFSYFYVSVMVAMKDLPATPFGCLNGCMEIPEHKSSLNSEGTCYCVVCAKALTKPETFKSVGCTSMLSLKVGYNRTLKKYYAERYGRYYYC